MKKFLHNLNCTVSATKSNCITFIALIVVFLVSDNCFAQPTVLGTQAVGGTYTTYDLTTVGGFKQIRLQATSAAATGVRNWEFATGTAGATVYNPNWRPNTGGNTLSTNTFIPTSFANGAKYNTGGGASGLLPAIISNNYYTFNVSNLAAADNVMQLLETSFNPVTLNTQALVVATSANGSSQVTVTTSAAPAAGEFVYIRSSNDGYVTSNITPVTFNGTTGVGYVATCSGNISYYIFSSNKTTVQLAADVSGNGQAAYDMATLNLLNNANANYTYTQSVVTNFQGNYYVPSVCYPTLASIIIAINGATLGGAVVVNIQNGYS